MDELTAFVRARLDEDEAAARAACEHTGATWATVWTLGTGSGRVTDTEGMPVSGTDLLAVAEHQARHDPARVLREVQAKRKLIEEVRSRSTRDVAEIYVATLAAVWSDHPDYRAKWAV